MRRVEAIEGALPDETDIDPPPLGRPSRRGIKFAIIRNPFAPLLPDFPHIAACHPYWCECAGCEGACNLSCAGELEAAIVREGPENVAAFVAEPVVMAGAAVAVPGYFEKIRANCDRYDVWIADEIITGFGRTGKYFASTHWDAVPDMIAIGKAASSGYVPLGAWCSATGSDRVFWIRGSRSHTYSPMSIHLCQFTYVNNPVAMRVCATVLDIIEEEEIIEHVVEVGDYLAQRAQAFTAHACVGDVRTKGLMMGIELVRDKEQKTPFAPEEGASGRGMALARGLSISGVPGVADWVRGDDLRFYPPLIISKEQIDEAVEIIDEVLGELDGLL